MTSVYMVLFMFPRRSDIVLYFGKIEKNIQLAKPDYSSGFV